MSNQMLNERSTQQLVPATALTAELVTTLRQKIPLLPALQPLDPLDAEQLSLVLSEHLSNICQYNSPTCWVSVELQTEPKILIIKDNGQNIFELLEQAKDNELPPALAESGRGLWILWHCFPNLHYHSVAAVNQLQLPLAVSKVHVVLIDDDLVQLALLEARLCQDYRITAFNDPLAALTYLLGHPADLIICDIRMPVLDGLTLRQRLLAHPEAQHVPFLFLSAADDDELKERAVLLSIDDYMTKPLQDVALKQIIRRILTRSQHVRESVDAKLDHALTSSLWRQLPASWQSWQLAQAYRVATRGGGDFVFQQQRPNSLLLLIGDVMGHGVQAKFFAFALSGYLQGLCYALAQHQSPSQLLHQLSLAVYNDAMLQKTLLTALAIELFVDGRIVISCAGHPPPYRFNIDQQWVELAVSGVLPGLIPNAQYEELTLQMQSGEMLLAYTDGLTEQYPGMKNTGATAIGSLFSMLTAKNNALSLNEFLIQITPEQLPDDVTVLSVRHL